MAGSRVDKLGTIFSRVTGLIRAGATKEEDRPLWYDVYKAFPPKLEPTFKRPFEMKEIKPILYPEDVVRSMFFKKYHHIGVIDITNKKFKLLSETFIAKYQELEKSGQYDYESDLFKATEDSLQLHELLKQRSIGQPQVKLPSTTGKGFAALLLEVMEKNNNEDEKQ